jgi:hypothetical protein
MCGLVEAGNVSSHFPGVAFDKVNPSAAYANIGYQYQPIASLSSLNCVQGARRRGVLGLREAMGYAMTCRGRLCGHGEALAKVAHA